MRYEARPAGVALIVVGVVIGVFAGVAQVIGIGDPTGTFGLKQIAGVILGASLLVAGLVIGARGRTDRASPPYRRGLEGGERERDAGALSLRPARIYGEKALPVIRRWVTSRSVWTGVIGVTALLVRLPLFFAEPTVFADTKDYLGFTDQTRQPGYGVFLWLAGLLPGRTVDAAVVCQHLIGVALAIAIVMVAWRLFDPVTGVLAGTLVALSPGLLTLEHNVLPDFLFAIFAFAGAVALACAAHARDQRWRILVLVGVLFALATYVKPVGQILIFAAPLTLWAATKGFRAYAQASAIVGVSMLLLLSPWVVRNAVGYGEVGMSSQAAVTLFNRVFEVDRLPVPTETAEGRRVAQLTATALRSPRIRPSGYTRIRPSSYVPRELGKQGWTWGRIHSLQRRLAVEAISAAPLTYAWNTVRQLGVTLGDITAAPYLKNITRPLNLAPAKRLTKYGIVAGTYLTQAWFILTLYAALGLVLLFLPGPRRAAAVSFLTVAGLVALVTALTHGGQWRYSMQVAPEAWIFGSAGLAYVGRAAFGQVRERLQTRPAAGGG